MHRIQKMFVGYVSLEIVLSTKGSITDRVMRCGSNFATKYWEATDYLCYWFVLRCLLDEK